MADSCCTVDTGPEADPGPEEQFPCPACGSRGPAVGFETVAAMIHVPVPPRQAFRLCREPICGTVYHGTDGARLTLRDLHVVPGFKGDSGRGLVCYCFLHDRQQIERELRETGRTTVPARITEQIQKGNCACEVRNPSGRCCLGEVNRAGAAAGTALEESET